MPTDALERITNLVALLLETREPLSQDRIVHELAGQYPADPVARRAAFERDKAALRGEGVPLEQTYLADGATGYWIERSRYELGDLGLTDEEKQALQVAVATVHLGDDGGAEALLKLAPSVDPTGVDGAAVAALPSLPALAPLFAATGARADVRFGYRGAARHLDPYGLLSRAGHWYVVGHDHDRGALRSFRVDRIEGAVTTGDAGSFEVPDGFDAAAVVADDVKALGGPDVEATEALVRIDRGWAGAVVRELGVDAVVERAGDGAVVVRVPCANLPAFRSWVLGFLEHAVVVGPPAVRADVVAWLEART
jgi:predicted DNA-binding transcriptional regulator YafY